MFVWVEILNQHRMNLPWKLLRERQMEIDLDCFRGAPARYNAGPIIAPVAGACAPQCHSLSSMTRQFSIQKKLPP
jgi:hypothetical protein